MSQDSAVSDQGAVWYCCMLFKAIFFTRINKMHVSWPQVENICVGVVLSVSMWPCCFYLCLSIVLHHFVCVSCVISASLFRSYCLMVYRESCKTCESNTASEAICLSWIVNVSEEISVALLRRKLRTRALGIVLFLYCDSICSRVEKWCFVVVFYKTKCQLLI